MRDAAKQAFPRLRVRKIVPPCDFLSDLSQYPGPEDRESWGMFQSNPIEKSSWADNRMARINDPGHAGNLK